MIRPMNHLRLFTDSPVGSRLLLALSAFALLHTSQVSALDPVVAEGMSVSEAMTPGLIRFPMMAAFDDQGALYVAENAGVNLNKEELLKEHPSSIKKLVDTDGDGIFDKVTTFADNMTFPQGAMWVYDSLYVMSPPSLWRLADEDGDGRAEIREELATGFDFTGNAADVHGPFLHPNGRLYWCHGRKGFEVRDTDTGLLLHSGKSARIWSSQLSGGEVEPFAGGGMDNPVEIDFTDEGEIIGSINLFYGRPRGDVLVHWIYGGVYPRFDQGQVLAELPRTGPLLPHAHNFGHVAVSGMCRYRSGSLNPSWKNGWLVTHFNTAEVTLTHLPARGASYGEGDTETIFRATKPDSHFTDVLEDRNGDLLVIDTGGWFRIGCPTSQIAKPDVFGMIYRLSKKDKPYTRPDYPNWDKLTAEQVSHHLSAPESWKRERAITELAVRGSSAMPELERILSEKSADPIGRISAVWTLSRMKFSESADLIYGALTDSDPRVRQTACNAISVTRTWQIVAANQPAERAIELERNKTISGALANIVRGDEAAVARCAAAALGRMAESRAIGAITGRLGRSGDDPFLRHALVYALMEMDDFAATRDGLSSDDPAIRSGILLALDGMASSKLAVLDVITSLEADDSALRDTALSIALRHHEWDGALANAFFSWHGAINEKRRKILDQIVPAFSTTPPMISFLTSLIQSEDAVARNTGLELVALSPGIPFQTEWADCLKKGLENDASPDFRTATVNALRTAHSDAFSEALTRICADESLEKSLRLSAAEALSRPGKPIVEAAFTTAVSIFTAPAEDSLRTRSISLLSKSALTPAQRDQLVTVLPHFSPIEWISFPEIFRSIDSPAQADALLKALTSASMLETLDSTTLKKRFASYPDTLAALESKLTEMNSAREDKKAMIEKAITTMDQADPAAGALVFSSGKGACIACHRVGELGGKVGPDLSTIGRIRTARDLYESVFFPSESIARDFDTYEVVLKSSGEVKTGLIPEQSVQGLRLINAAGSSEMIPQSDVATIRKLTTSIMPSGLDQTLSTEDLRNLIAWLLSHK